MRRKLAIKDTEMEPWEFNITPGVIHGYLIPKKRKITYFTNIFTINNQIIKSDKLGDEKLELQTYDIKALDHIPLQIDDVNLPHDNIYTYRERINKSTFKNSESDNYEFSHEICKHEKSGIYILFKN